jgi:hypothetical protein
MARNYALRLHSLELPSDWHDSEDAISTIDGSSSPLLISNHLPGDDSVPFLSLNSDGLLSDDIYDQTFSPDHEHPTYAKMSNDEKAIEILRFMKDQFPHDSHYGISSNQSSRLISVQ